jgi:Spy/CpxP family protein refolding chaperone
MPPKSALLVKASVLALCIATGTTAGAHARGHGGCGAPRLDEVLAPVPLGVAQRQQIRAIRVAARAQAVPLVAQVQAVRQQIATTLLSSGTVTEAQMVPLVQQREALRRQLDRSHMQTQLAIRNVLTGTQLVQAASVQAELSLLRQRECAITTPAGG